MSKSIRRIVQILTIALVLMLGTCVCFASPVVVSPASNSIVSGDSILVSVKITEKQAIRVSILRQMEETRPAKYEAEVLEDGTIEEKEISPAVYTAYDASKLTEADLAKIAEGKTKDENGKDITLSTGAAVKPLFGELVSDPVDYTNNSEIGFYTKKINELKPGLYMIRIEVLEEAVNAGSNGNAGRSVKETIDTYVAVKEKPKEENVTGGGIFNTQKNSAWQLIQNILKSLFR